jgi:hypothetical protein
MKKVIITNNKKVEYSYAGKAEVIMLDKASSLNVLQEGIKIALKGGRLLLDPTRRKGYYKSLIFYMEEGKNTPDEKSISILNKSINELTSQGNITVNKEPILAGILQNRDLDLVRSVFR